MRSTRSDLVDSIQDIDIQLYKLRIEGFDKVIIDDQFPRAVQVAPPEQEEKVAFHLPEVELKKMFVAVNKPPFQKNEPHIQALRYLKGFLLIGKHSANREAIFAEAERLRTKINNNMSFDDVCRLADEFANFLKKDILITLQKNAKSPKEAIKKAHTQLTMARDLGVLLEDSATICTISGRGNHATKEISRPVIIHSSYYDREFKNLDQKIWFIKAKEKACLEGNNTWLDHFFREELNVLKDKGTPAPPSARWLPLPGNVQEVEVITGTLQDAKENDPITTDEVQKIIDGTAFSDDALKTEFLRMGIVAAFGISDYSTQDDLARKILIEIVSARIAAAVQNYRDSYQNYANGTFFFINYQTLLTPHHVESHIKLIKDNNARFVKLAKEVLADKGVQDQMNAAVGDLLGTGKDKITLIFAQTNSSVNKLVVLPTAKNFDELEEGFRKMKLDQIARLIKNMSGAQVNKLLIQYLKEDSGTEVPKNITVIQLAGQINKFKEILDATNLSGQTKNDIILRIRAAVHLQLLMRNASPYKDLPGYQRNIMRASFEFLTQGAQGIKLVGCKSARDRTAIFAAAVKTMQENPHAMDDWETLDKGIIASITQGHHFRSMGYHVPIVKAGDVHSYFVDQLDEDLQKYIKSIKPISKILEDSPPEPEQAIAAAPPSDVKSPKLFAKLLKKVGVVESVEEKSPVRHAAISPFITENLRVKEDRAIEYLAEFQREILKYNWGFSTSLAGGYQKVHFFANEQTKTINVPLNIKNMLDEMTSAVDREQTFQQALEKIILIAVEESQQSSAGRNKQTQLFYNTALKKLGIDGIGTLQYLEEIIKKEPNEFNDSAQLLECIKRSKIKPETRMTSDELQKHAEDAAFSALNKVVEITNNKNQLAELLDKCLVMKQIQPAVALHVAPVMRPSSSD